MTNHRSPPPNFRQPLHRHQDWRLIVFLSGQTVEESFAGAHAYQPGDFLFRPAYFAHADRTGALGGAYARFPVTRQALRRHFAAHGWRALRGSIGLDVLDLDRRTQCNGGGDDLLPLLDRTAYEPNILSSTHRLANEVANESVSLTALAERHGLRPYQFTRLFVRTFGILPGAYRKQARLQRAIKAIAESDEPLARIAGESGFHDQSHFTRTLARATHCTPGQMRRFLRLI